METSDHLKVAVVVVNYNAAELARAAVDSVLARTHNGHQVHVYLVDNASTDDSTILLDAARTPEWQRHVTFLAETTNHGFGRGNNLAFEAMAASAPDMVFLLNPDASLQNEALAILAEFLRDTPDVAVAGAQIVQPGSGPVAAAFRFPTAMNEFAGATGFGPIMRAFARWRLPLPADLPAGPVDWIAGAAVMLRYDVVRDMGGFDSRFFLYYEEVELMRRIKNAGWQIWYQPAALVSHVEGASTNVKSNVTTRKRKPAYWYDSWQYYFRKTHGRSGALLAAFAWLSGATINHVISVLRGRPPSRPLNFFSDFWCVSLRPLLGLKARPYE